MRAGMHRFYSPQQSPADTKPHRRRGQMRNSLQGKLVLTFVGLVTLSLTCACWLFATQSGQQITDSMGEQARQVAFTLSLASAPAYVHKNRTELDQISAELLKTRNILYVAFYNSQ